MAENKIKVESQFTKENILALKDSINASINTYVETQMNGQKLDLFLILASLEQAAFEVVMRSMPADNDDAKKAHDEMKQVADVIVSAVDANRKEVKTRSIAELLGTIHATSIVAEFYARRRDEYIAELQKQSDMMNGELAVMPESDVEIIEPTSNVVTFEAKSEAVESTTE